jgi:BMFP domain-containing protein YqiC
MQTQNRILDDLAKMASGAMSGLSGLRHEIEMRAREQIERILARMDLVKREEFEAVKAMAAKAREEQEKLAEKLAELEKRLKTPKQPRSGES